MFASLLPGIRDLRAPLAAGYLWLTVMWVWLAAKLPKSPDQAKGLLRDVYDLAQVAGRPATGIALSFAAYVIGVIMVAVSAQVLKIPLRIVASLGSWTRSQIYRFLVRFVTPRLRRFLPVDQISVDPAYDEVYGTVIEALDKRFQDDGTFREQLRDHLDSPNAKKELMKSGWTRDNVEKLIHSALTRSYGAALRKHLLELVIHTHDHAREVLNDLRYVPQRVIETKPKTFERYDQLRAEAEFRSAVGLPLLFLIIAVAYRMALHPYIFILLILSAVVLLMQGHYKAEAAQVQLASAVRTDPAVSPPLADVQTGMVRWITGELTVRYGIFGVTWTEHHTNAR